METVQLEEHLKRWFGYNTFRSYQKDIVENVLQGKDVLAILPTGAGKSLCYQLPALLVPGTAVVVSPLISLMQDQVSALAKGGIPAAYVNSSLPWPEISEILNNLSNYKLLYIAPERFNDPNFMGCLKTLPLSFFVIDEAHCISQWGHSFRPDYRQLSLLKREFPGKPIMALTATATAEVQNDIIAQLTLEKPFIAKGSFDRPNLTIRIDRKVVPSMQIFDYIKKHPGESGIVYASTRKTVDSLYEELKKKGLSIGRYHAGMNDKDRHAALHDFIHDKTLLMIATVAFGMGINEPDVRFILHHDMPKTIEQYYQEIGRAGRDGLPAECLMLYGGQDLATYRYFLQDVTDPILKAQAENKTKEMYWLCSSSRCRRVGLLRYFGESYHSNACNNCDLCIDDEEKEDGTIIAQKILSCVYRLKESFGVHHLIDVLRGSKSQPVLSRGHDQLSTYNLMPEFSESELRYYIDSLIGLGLLQSSGDRYAVLKWTEYTRAVVVEGKKVEFRKKIFKEKVKEAFAANCNEELLSLLKGLRLEISREEGIPPFGVFADRSLIEMATTFPASDTAFLEINGVGRFKFKTYGARFLELIGNYCKAHNIPQSQASAMPAALHPKLRPTSPPKSTFGPTAELTVKLFQENKSIAEIADIRCLTVGTIVAHLTEAIDRGIVIDLDRILSPERKNSILSTIQEVGLGRLKPIKDKLPEDYSYDEIRLVVAGLRSQDTIRGDCKSPIG